VIHENAAARLPPGDRHLLSSSAAGAAEKKVIRLWQTETEPQTLAALNQIRSIDKRRLVRRLGILTPATLERVDRAVLISLGLVEI
jgi:mRNA-degrading endonuclease toxin of MazEF toxin-antitoxin module